MNKLVKGIFHLKDDSITLLAYHDGDGRPYAEQGSIERWNERAGFDIEFQDDVMYIQNVNGVDVRVEDSRKRKDIEIEGEQLRTEDGEKTLYDMGDDTGWEFILQTADSPFGYKPKYIVFSLNETQQHPDLGPACWNNEAGWSPLGQATIFTQEEMMGKVRLPVGGQWVALPNVSQNWGPDPLKKASFYVDYGGPNIDGYTDGSRWWGGVYIDAKVTRAELIRWLKKNGTSHTVDSEDPDVLYITTGGIHDVDTFKPAEYRTDDGIMLLYDLTDWRLILKGEEHNG
jgi:hypothetical protein